MISTAQIPADELGQGTKAVIRVVPDAQALQQAFEEDVLGLLRARQGADDRLVVVFPVGPVQFRELAGKLNRSGLSLAHFYVFFMDEFCDSAGQWVPLTHPMSLRSFAQSEFLSLLDPATGWRPENTHVPDPQSPQRFDAELNALGGADVVYTGFGINGHWAFNDPRPDLTVAEFADLPTRVVTLAEATRVQTAMGGTAGDLEGIPPKAVTIGMRQLLAAREIHCYLPRSWHAGVIRRALHGPVTSAYPGSLLQLHQHVELTLPTNVAELPEVLVTQKL
jgi:glucosamine-6-phosphate deaminase